MTYLFQKLYRFFFPFHISGVNNQLDIPSKRSNVKITIHGNNNTVDIAPAKNLENLNILILGDNNHLSIGENARIYGPCSIRVEDGAKVLIGHDTGLRGVKILARESSISIGNDCMTSYGVTIRNHDSHNVLDANRTICNPPKDIIIEDHVWIGENVTILKGTKIKPNSIAAFGAILTKQYPPNCIIAGNPGVVVKENITWSK